jgi:hypothetical protein
MAIGLELLREPFPENQVGKLPKGTKQQNECSPSEQVNCKICGGWHHPKIVHLDFVGHAALTNRLLDVDINWYWEPMALDERGLPAFDATGGLWIRLTVAGQTRIGYGNAATSQYKDIGSREKEVVGDALRNAAMRFGAALSLWHKGGDLYVSEHNSPEVSETGPGVTASATDLSKEQAIKDWLHNVNEAYKECDLADFKDFWPASKEEILHDTGQVGAAKVYKEFTDLYKKKKMEVEA